MHKRNRNLIVLLSLMLLLVIGLCACMTNEKPEETENITSSSVESSPVIDEWESDEPTTVTESASNVQQPTQNQGAQDPTLTTQATESTTESTATSPTDTTQSTTPQSPYAPGTLSYTEYMELDAEQQQLYALAFDSVEDYIRWFNAVKAENDNSQAIEITGPVDLGEFNGND